jgi:hypothetical protein
MFMIDPHIALHVPDSMLAISFTKSLDGALFLTARCNVGMGVADPRKVSEGKR